jgi:hypothetical protein
VHNIRPTLALAAPFGGVLFVIMFWGQTLPAPVDWVPLLVLSVTVGAVRGRVLPQIHPSRSCRRNDD